MAIFFVPIRETKECIHLLGEGKPIEEKALEKPKQLKKGTGDSTY